jgi:hypothetical protein
MAIKNKSRHIKLKFWNVCTKVESKFQKISNYYKYGIPRPISGWIFAEKKQIISPFLTFALANYSMIDIIVYDTHRGLGERKYQHVAAT